MPSQVLSITGQLERSTPEVVSVRGSLPVLWGGGWCPLISFMLHLSSSVTITSQDICLAHRDSVVAFLLVCMCVCMLCVWGIIHSTAWITVLCLWYIYIPMTYLFSKWKFVSFEPLQPFCPLPNPMLLAIMLNAKSCSSLTPNHFILPSLLHCFHNIITLILKKIFTPRYTLFANLCVSLTHYANQ